MRAATLFALMALAAALPVPAQEPGPSYPVEKCCDLCPQAASRAAYNTPVLKSYATLLQGSDGWLFRSEQDLRATFGPPSQAFPELKRLRNALRERGVDLVVLYQPSRALLNPDVVPKEVRYEPDLARFSYAMALKRFGEAGIPAPDLTKLVYEPGERPYFFRGDHHWTPSGARRAAALVADAVRALPVYEQLPRRKFVTERTGLLGKKGSLHKAASTICGFGYPDEFVERYATAAEAASGEALFADEGVPRVALVAGGNGDQEYNFAGFLAEALQTDVLNASIAGDRQDHALLQYLHSVEFQNAPPQVLVWELDDDEGLTHAPFYRQAVPLARNGCRNRKVALSNQVKVKGQRADVLFNGGGRVLPLQSRNLVLDLQVGGAAVREVDAVVWYTNGSSDTVELRPMGDVDNGGRFVSELRGDGEWGGRTFMSLDLKLPKSAANVDVTAKLCGRDPAPADDARPRKKKV